MKTYNKIIYFEKTQHIIYRLQYHHIMHTQIYIVMTDALIKLQNNYIENENIKLKQII